MHLQGAKKDQSDYMLPIDCDVSNRRVDYENYPHTTGFDDMDHDK